MSKHQDLLSLSEPGDRVEHVTNHKTAVSSLSDILGGRKISDQSIRFDTAAEVLPADIYFIS